ncbi:MAG: phospholipase [Deltaproteobacteria bacterium]|nr:phospholipase [Deltaproteobacteria bacterium]
MPSGTDLSRLSTDDIEATLDAIRDRRVVGPLTASRLSAAGVAVDVVAVASACGGLPADSIAPVLAAVLAERRRGRPGVELVWTGPEPSGATTRDTARVLEHLFRDARTEVLLAGFSFDHGATLFAKLHHAMVTRNVACDFFVDIPGDQQHVRAADEERLVSAHVAGFLAAHWPWRARPRFFYDPRRFDPTVYASIHAKCVVVDSRYAFVTSANFTDRGQTRNVEVGLLVDDAQLAGQLGGHLRRCAQQDIFRQVPTGWLPPLPSEDPP